MAAGRCCPHGRLPGARHEVQHSPGCTVGQLAVCQLVEMATAMAAARAVGAAGAATNRITWAKCDQNHSSGRNTQMAGISPVTEAPNHITCIESTVVQQQPAHRANAFNTARAQKPLGGPLSPSALTARLRCSGSLLPSACGVRPGHSSRRRRRPTCRGAREVQEVSGALAAGFC